MGLEEFRKDIVHSCKTYEKSSQKNLDKKKVCGFFKFCIMFLSRGRGGDTRINQGSHAFLKNIENVFNHVKPDK